jgi:hypothetical protein
MGGIGMDWAYIIILVLIMDWFLTPESVKVPETPYDP